MSEKLERRLAALEKRHAALRDFVVPALWDALDRLDERAPDLGPAACLACGRTGPAESFGTRTGACVFGGGRLTRLECPDCGCVFGPLKYLRTPAPVVDADYRLLYADYSEGDSTEAEIRAFRALNPRPGGLYLNWGSGGWSESVERLRAEGWEVWGYEPHAETASPHVVRRREEVSARFDGIFSNNVIEHLFDPAEAFRDYRTILKPGGRMAHASPCFDWAYDYTRFHVFFPLGRSLDRLAARTGFDIVDRIDDDEFRCRVLQAATD